MENEVSKTKIIFAVAVGIVFVVMVALFIAMIVRQQVNKTTNQRLDRAPALQSTIKEKEIISEDKINFEDPGNDEVGQVIKVLDALINGTTPSELSGDDLSDEMIESGL